MNNLGNSAGPDAQVLLDFVTFEFLKWPLIHVFPYFILSCTLKVYNEF